MMIKPSALMMSMRRSVSPGKPSRAKFGKNETTPGTEGFRTGFGLRSPGLAVSWPELQALLAGRAQPAAISIPPLANSDCGAETLVIGILPIFARIASARITVRWRSAVVADM
jgi:hypothetical protein